MKNRVLLAGFRNTSAHKLITLANDMDTLIFPNDLIVDGEMLVQRLEKGCCDIAICVGQKPGLKNKVCIETSAKAGNESFTTIVDCEKLALLFSSNGLKCRISNRAGTSFCNEVYLNGLRYVSNWKLEPAVVFIHIPFEENIQDPLAFYKNFLSVIEELKSEEAAHLWKRSKN